MKRISLIKVSQPIGFYFIGKMTAGGIDSISCVNRIVDGSGVQRRLNTSKVNEIKNYCGDPDAVFPTSIILAIEMNKDTSARLIQENDLWVFEYDENEKCAEIIDGQHRIAGILEAKSTEMEMPVVFMFDLTEEEKAYVFSTINSNQTKVDKSTIYELFSLSKTRSPFKTCHELARAFNSSVSSPFYKRLKMLGYKETENESITQGTFVQEIIKLISRDLATAKQDAIDIKNSIKLNDNTSIPLRRYFISNQDDIIYRILFNYFSAVANVFPLEWGNPKDFILTKTTGFCALIMLFPTIHDKGIEEKDLSLYYFTCVFEHIKKNGQINFISSIYGSGIQAQKKLRDDLLNSLKM